MAGFNISCVELLKSNTKIVGDSPSVLKSCPQDPQPSSLVNEAKM